MKAAYRAGEDDALALFARAPVIHLASIIGTGIGTGTGTGTSTGSAAGTGAGRPILRTLHGVVVDGRIAFHGGDHGDKVAVIGREAVLSAEEVIAEIPSHFIDPERACPATTYYRSAMARGVVRRVEDLDRKARVLQALMERFQPEGRHVPITAGDPRYRKSLETLLIAELVPDRLSAKHKLGQNRNARQIEQVMAGLWQRGEPGDLRAIRTLFEEHPGSPEPGFLRGPDGVALCCAPDRRDAGQVAEILAPQHWNEGLSPEVIARAHLGGAAWVVARDRTAGAVIATARASGDGARHAHVMDVVVVDAWRGQGLGAALMGLLLDHPALRSCANVQLRTRDAQRFYRRFGFATSPDRFDEMVMRRSVVGE